MRAPRAESHGQRDRGLSTISYQHAQLIETFICSAYPSLAHVWYSLAFLLMTNISSMASLDRPPHEKWMENYRAYFRYMQEHSCHPSRASSSSNARFLANWEKLQRKHYSLLCKGKKSPMTHSKILLLKSIDFDFNLRGMAHPVAGTDTSFIARVGSEWYSSFKRLRSLSVHSLSSDFGMKSWVSRQRRSHDKGTLGPLRRTLLLSLGLSLPLRDHIGREYFNRRQYDMARTYVEHRLGSFETSYKSTDFVGLSQVLLENAPDIARIKPCLVTWSHTECNSVCLKPDIGSDIVENAMKCIPSSLFPANANSTKEDLVKQMSLCNELDDIHVLTHGNSLPRQRLNETEYPQPRRVSWLAVVQDQHFSHEAGHNVYTLFSYSQTYRKKSDWRGRPMPTSIYQLALACWTAAFPYLPSISQACPPTHCQLMAYHTIFNGHVGHHRDNGHVAPPATHTRDECSQIRGSAVLSFTVGTQMEFSFRRPPEGKSIFNAKKEDYLKNTDLACTLSEGSLFVLDPVDDENFRHEAYFAKSIKESTNEPRIAFMFRWLAKQHEFYADKEKAYAMVPL